jgi:hypothetical protein
MKPLLPLLFLLSGCATTRIEVVTPEGLHVRASFPKNMEATNLRISVAGHELTADRLRTDASSVVEAQGSLVADITNTLSP